MTNYDYKMIHHLIHPQYNKRLYIKLYRFIVNISV